MKKALAFLVAAVMLMSMLTACGNKDNADNKDNNDVNTEETDKAAADKVATLIDAIYVLCSYTYGPLLGLFAFGLLTRRAVNDRLVPYVCLASPLLCYALDITAQHLWGYRFGYELLMINGAFTFAGLWATNSAKK